MALVKALQNKKAESFYFIQGAIDAGWVRVWRAQFEPVYSTINGDPLFSLMIGGVTVRLTTMRSKSKIEEEFLFADSIEL